MEDMFNEKFSQHCYTGFIVNTIFWKTVKFKKIYSK